MKKLSLLMFTILILGCGTETTVVKEPEAVELIPVAIEDEPPTPPHLAEGSVLDGDVHVDPEPLNRDGITFRFTAPLRVYAVDLRHNFGKSLRWYPRDVIDLSKIGQKRRQLIKIIPMADSQLLEYDTKYRIEIYAQSYYGCERTQEVIVFQTKPR